MKNKIYLSLSEIIGENSAKNLMAGINSISKDKNYGLRLSTVGGETYWAGEIINTVFHKEKAGSICIETIGMTVVESAGIYVLQTGKVRLCYPNTEFLLHLHSDSASKVSNQEKMFRYLSDRSGTSYEKIFSLASDNDGQGIRFMGHEAKEFGFVDYVIYK